ncbi:MAG: hypothetical protein ACRBB3_02485 [Alphaproteobacteria bacterium]
MLKKFIKLFVPCAIITLSTMPLSHAQTNKPQLESIGLYDTTHKYSLGSGVYHKSNRIALTTLLENTRTSNWTALNREINHFLLTSADAPSLESDSQQVTDLFTMRFNALLQRGLNKEAFDLFSKIPEGTKLNSLAYPGVITMLLNKEKALACLETKALSPSLKNTQFWKELDAYCTISLSNQNHNEKEDILKNTKNVILNKIISDKKFTFEYTPTSFAALSPIERAILTAEDKITLKSAHKDTPPQDIAPLLQQSSINEETRVVLTIQAVKHGIFELSALTSLYEEISKKDHRKNGIYKIISLYDETKEGWLPKRRKDKIEKVFILADKYGDLALLPLLPILIKMEPGDDISIENTKRTLSLFLYSDLPFPSDWIDNLEEITTDKPNDISFYKLRLQTLLTAKILDKTLNNNASTDIDSSASADLQFITNIETLKNIIDSIDINTGNDDKVQYIYENDFDLNENRSYTMPPSIVMDALRQSSTNQDIGVTLLLSNAILSGIKNEELYLGTLSDICIALSKIGSKKLSHRILAQAILEIEN